MVVTIVKYLIFNGWDINKYGIDFDVEVEFIDVQWKEL